MKEANRSLLVVGAIVIFIVIGVFASYQKAPTGKTSVQSGIRSDFENLPAPAADVLLIDAQGKNTHLETYRGKPFLINFWASWCGPCVEELPSFLEFSKWAKDSLGVEVIAISEDESWTEIKGLFKKMGVSNFEKTTMKVFKDDTGKAAALYGTVKYPETFFVDAEYNVIRKFVGSQNWNSYDIKDWVTKHSR